MIVRVDPDYLEHASKSKYKGGFTKDGKNTSAYNHDYYIHNKEKWKKEGEQIEGAPEGVTYDDLPGMHVYEGDKVGWTDQKGEHHGLSSNYEPEYSTSGHGNHSRKRNGGIDQSMMWYSDYKEKYGKKAKVFKRGEGIGGGPSGTKDYSNRSSVSVNKRKKGRKPVGKVWNVKY